MIYVVSDIHGCYDKYKALLKQIAFSSDDTLYVLGDVIDRGPDGFKILLDMLSRPNVVCLLGNHEAMALDVLPIVIQNKNIWRKTKAIKLWFANGGKVSLSDFLLLSSKQAQTILDYMLAMPLYKEVEVGGRTFVLVHGGLENFSPSRALDDYTADEIVWCRSDMDTIYFQDKYVVFGHTPVQFFEYDIDRGYGPVKIYHKNGLIDIDCGAVFKGGKLACLCLDTMEEFYI